MKDILNVEHKWGKHAGTEDMTLWVEEVELRGELTERSEPNKSNKLSKAMLQSWELK